MVPTLEAIKGGGGSVKVGTKGKISALMSKEVDSTKYASQVPSLCTSISVSDVDTIPRKLKPRTSIDEARSRSRSTSSLKNHKSPETMTRMKQYSGCTHHIPMLEAADIPIDGTPIKQNSFKKRPGIVEIVDIKCGNPETTWVNPIKNRLKRLGFSKLSDSNV